MAEEQEDVQADPSPAPDADAHTEAAAVTGSRADAEEKDPTGVPWRNRMIELDRKHERQMADLQAMFQQQIQQMQQPRIEPTKPVQQQYTDEELLALGNQGHSVAMQEYISRQVQRQTSAQQRVNLGEQTATALRQLYPDFNDQRTPLYQAANQLYRQYLAAGEPADTRTQALAMSTAAAALSRQQMQQQGTAAASEGARDRSVDAHQSVAGSSVAPAGANRPRAKAPTAEQQAIAQKLGVKDAGKALANFQKRQQEGRSSFGGGLSSAAERMLP